MNILPMVFAFILIFGGVSLALIRDMKGLYILEKSIDSQERSHRVLNNNITSYAYGKFKGEPFKKQSDPSPRAPQTFQSRRTFFTPFENSKLNLMPLFEYESDYKQHPLYHHIAEFLRLLYQNKVFATCKDANCEYRLLDALLEKGRSLKEFDHFRQLAPDDPALYALYYKLLKGTNHYDETQGFPPFEDYFCLRKKAPAISFSFASPPLLEALFNKVIKDKILKTEQEAWEKEKKYTYFSKEDLQALIAEHPSHALLFATLEPLLDFSKEYLPRIERGGKDRTTQIAVRKKL